MSVQVNNLNRPPRISPVADQAGKIEETLSFNVQASDPDSDSVELTASGLPTGATFSSGSFSWKPAAGQTGNYPVKIKAWDGKDSDLVVVLLTVGDIALPPPLVVEITSPERDTTVNTPSLRILYTVNGVPLQKTVALKDGKTKIFIDTTALGRTGLDTVNVTLDTLPPNRPILSGRTPVRTLTPTWTWKPGGGGSGIYRYRLDSADMAAATLLADTLFTAPKDLAPGTHTLFVQERDAAGNWSPTGSHLIRIDIAPPNPPGSASDFTVLVNTSKPTWTWISGGNDGMGVYRLKIDNNDLATNATQVNKTSFTSLDSLTEGMHILYVQESDSAGNWSATSAFSLRIDRTPPAAPVFATTPLSPLNSLQPNWTWTSGGGGMGVYRYKLDTADLSVGAGSLQSGAFKPTANLSQGKHTLYVQERDSAGNWSSAGSRELFLSQTGIVGQAGFSAGMAHDLSIAISKKGTPFVGFSDLNDNGKAKVMNFNGTSWVNVGSPGFSPGEAGHPTLALSSDATPYLAFSDKANHEKVSVMRFIGGAWENVGTAGFSLGAATFPSMTIGPDDIPFVAFTDVYNEEVQSTVMKFDGNSWVTLGATGFYFGSGNFPKIAINNVGQPYVVFANESDHDKITVLRYSAASWQLVGRADFASGADPSLAINNQGVPYVSFANESNNSMPSVMRYNGADWEPVGGLSIATGQSVLTSLAFDSNGQAIVAFDDGSNGGKLTVSAFNESSWKVVGRRGISDDEVYSFSLAIGEAGVPYVLYSDGLRMDKTTVIKTAFDP